MGVHRLETSMIYSTKKSPARAYVATAPAFAMLGLVLLTGCALQQRSEAQKTMVGMSKDQVRGCMGAPEATAMNGSTETWTYASPNRGKSGGQCKADLVMSEGRLSRIDYRGDAGDQVTKGGICGFIVEKCAPP
jgi:hypothetical protein